MAQFQTMPGTFPYRLSTMEEDYSAAQIWLKNKNFGPFINGRFIVEGNSEVHQMVNPWTGNSLATVRISTSEDIHNAVVSSIISQNLLTQYNLDRSFKFFQQIAGRLEKHHCLFAQIDSLNRGVLASTPKKFDLPGMVAFFKYYANVFYEDGINKICEKEKTKSCTVAIVTKDTPLIALAWLLAPAFALERSVCLVVPKETALSAMLFAQVCIEGSGFDGILNILPGNESTVDEIVSHGKVSHVMSFGPTTLIRHIKEITAGTSKLSIAMSGLTQMLVFDTADVVAAVDCAAKSAWHYQGAVPWALKTVFVHDSLFKEFVNLLKRQLDRLKVGSPGNKQADVGPSYERCVMASTLVENALRAGIEVFQVPLPENTSGLYFPLTILIGSHIDHELLLGLPVLSVIPFRTPKEGIALANNTRFTLGASIWLENLSLSLSVADSLKVGNVWINTHGMFDPAVPFGGWKEGCTGSFGGLTGFRHAFTKKDSVCPYPSSFPILKPGGVRGNHYSGERSSATEKNSITVFVDEQPFASIALATSESVRAAVNSCAVSQERWALVSPAVRADTLHNLAERLSGECIPLRTFCSTPADMDLVALHAISKIHWWASACATNVSWTVQPTQKNVSVRVNREPLGVVVVALKGGDIVTLLSTVSVILRYGNSALVVLNVADALPTLPVFMAIKDVLPSGLVNILVGDANLIVPQLVLDPDIHAVWAPECCNDLATVIERNAALDMTPTYFESCVQATPLFFEHRLTKIKAIWMSKGSGLC